MSTHEKFWCPKCGNQHPTACFIPERTPEQVAEWHHQEQIRPRNKWWIREAPIPGDAHIKLRCDTCKYAWTAAPLDAPAAVPEGMVKIPPKPMSDDNRRRVYAQGFNEGVEVCAEQVKNECPRSDLPFRLRGLQFAGVPAAGFAEKGNLETFNRGWNEALRRAVAVAAGVPDFNGGRVVQKIIDAINAERTK